MTILLGTLLGQGLVVLVSPFLTRLYSATDFGTLAVVTALASVLGAGATIGTDRALAVAHEPAEVRALVLVGLTGTGLVGGLSAIGALALRDALADRFSAPALSELWWIVPVTTVAIGTQRIGSAVLARSRRHGAIAVRNACQGLGQTAWNFGMAFAGPIGLVGGLAAGRLMAVFGMVRAARVPSRAAVAEAVRAHRRFLVLSPWSAMLNVIGQQAPTVVIAAAHGSATAGFVALTMRVLGSPVGMVADAVAQYAAGAFGADIRSGTPVRALFVRLTARLFLLGGVAAAIVVLLGPACFGAVFGPEWARSGSYAQILAPAFAVQVAVSPVSQVLSMLGRQGVQLVWDSARLVTTTGAVLVPSLSGYPMTVVLTSLAVAMTVSYAAMLVLIIGATRRGSSTSPS